MRAGIDCVAVTDHNSGEWIDRLKAALINLETIGHPEFHRLYLFPGIEVSAHGGVHVLGILDPTASTADVTQLLGSVGYRGTRGASDAVTDKTPVQVAEEIEKAGGIAIPAHADRPNGALTQLVGKTLAQLLDCQSIAAMEVCDPGFAKPAPYEQRNPGWADVLGSDSHHPTGNPGQRFPGSHFSWVKMGRPSLEGLRLALLDGAPLSVRRSEQQQDQPNRHAVQLIEEIEIREARLCGRGQPLGIQFNPWLNTVIGGRGTGKSTIAEFLRIGLRRDKELTNKLAEDFGEFFRLPRGREDRGALTDSTELRIIYRKDGTRFRLQWNQAGSRTPIESERHDGTWERESGDIPQRFPVRMFSQKQVFSLSESEAGLRRIVDDAREVSRSDWDAEWREQEARFLALRARERELTEKMQAIPRLEGELSDLKRKLAVFESAEQAALLKSYQRRQRQGRELAHVEDDLARIAAWLKSAKDEVAITTIDLALFDDDDPKDREVLAELDKVRAAVADVQTVIAELGSKVKSAAETWRAALQRSQWNEELTATESRYRQWVEALQVQGVSDPAQYGQLVQRRQVIEQELRALDRLTESIKETRTQSDQALDRLRGLRRELMQRRRDFLAQALRDNRFVRIDVRPYQCSPSEIESGFRALIGRTDERLADDILSEDGSRGVIADLYRDLPADQATAGAEVEKRLDAIKENLIAVARGQESTRFGAWFVRHLRGLKPEVLDRVEIWYPEDGLSAAYSVQGDGADFKPIQQGSPGQRTAAMLAFLLAYGEEPMVLDQPEDDLDNHLIYDLIVRQVRENKLRRQLIVVTHNPNIVVNGDAELVVAMDFRGGQCLIVERGSLQEQAVRAEVCRVMEGGEQAFRQRYRRLVERTGRA
jgi:PHP family Zn ribbon phosphoesterase